MALARFSEQVVQLRNTIWERPHLFIPFVGSGVSQGLPSWVDLLKGLAQQLPETERAEVDIWIQQRMLLQVASYLEASEHVGRSAISTAIAQHYSRPNCKAPDVFSCLAELPFDHFITTNYDPWLKNSLASRLSAAPRVYTPFDPGAFANLDVGSPAFVLMLHGDADRPETCILSEGGITRLLNANPQFLLGMRAVLAQRRLIFVGYSISDLDLIFLLREWYDTFAATGAPLRHIYLGAGISRAARVVLQSRGISAVEYEEHSRLPETLRFLSTKPTGSDIVANDGQPSVLVVQARSARRATFGELVLRPCIPSSRRILLVDDDVALPLSIARFLNSRGYQVAIADQGHAALKILEQGTGCDLVLTDKVMPGLDGLKLAEKVIDKHRIPVIVMTGAPTTDAWVDAQIMGCAFYLAKPIMPDELVRAIAQATDDDVREFCTRAWPLDQHARASVARLWEEIRRVVETTADDSLVGALVRHKVKELVYEFSNVAAGSQDEFPDAMDLVVKLRKLARAVSGVQLGAGEGLVAYLRNSAYDLREANPRLRVRVDIAQDVSKRLVGRDTTLWILCAMELLDNAREALGGVGVIRIKLRCMRTSPTLVLGVWTSSKIASDIASRVFEEGVTTRAHHRGLGLSLVERAVHRLGGTIRFVEDEGVLFEISAPV